VINEIMYHDTPVAGQPANVVQNTAIDYRRQPLEVRAVWHRPGRRLVRQQLDDSAWTTGQGVVYGGNVPGVVGAPPRPSPSRAFSGTALNAAGQLGVSGAVDPHWVVTPPAAPRRSPRSS